MELRAPFALDDQNIGVHRIGTPTLHVAGSWSRLVQVPWTNQMGAFGAGIRQCDIPEKIDVALDGNIPVLQVSVHQIRAQDAERRRRCKSCGQRKWISQRQQSLCTRKEQTEIELRRVE